MDSVAIYGIKLPIVEERADLAELIVNSAVEQGLGLEDGDVIAVTCKILSKSMGLIVKLNEVKPSDRALRIASKVEEDPRFIEVLLRESDKLLLAIPVKKLADEGILDFQSFSRDPELAKRTLDEFPTIFLVLRDGMLWTDAGLDSSNHPLGIVSIPPRNSDEVARSIRDRIRELTGKEVSVVVCDTEAFLAGSIDIARGSYGIEPIDRGFGEPDLYGKPKFGGIDAIAHEVCASAALVMRQTGQGIPVALIRGLRYESCECGYRDRVRTGRNGSKAIRHIISHTRKVLGVRHFLRMILHVL